MHEFGLAESTLNIAMERARAQGAEHIHAISLRIGALAGVVEEAFTFAFECLADGTIAQGAKLSIEHVPISCYCSACAREFETRSFSYRCPDCGQPSADVRRGREMDLVSMEVS
jgi:hydrogenase nickel incorporation protein HypA/HybF